MAQPGVGPSPPASGSGPVPPAQPPCPAQSPPRAGSGHVWVLSGPWFLLCSPQIGPLPGHSSLALKNVRLQPPHLLTLPHPRGREGVSSPTPARAGEAVWWEQGPGYGLEPPPERPAFLSQCSYPVKSEACWRSAQGVLKGFHMLFEDPLLMRALAMPSVPVSVRANKKLGTTHRSQWYLLASDRAGGAGPLAAFLWTVSRDSSKSQEPSPEGGIWSQAVHCRPSGLPLPRPASPFAAGAARTLMGRCAAARSSSGSHQPPNTPLCEGASSPRRLLQAPDELWDWPGGGSCIS